MVLYYDITKAPNIRDLPILGLSTIGVRSCKSKHMTRNKDSLTMTANDTTKKENDSSPLILIASTENVHNHESKGASTKNENNK